MNYRLRKEYTKNSKECLKEILIDRGVNDIDNFLSPSKKCELNPYLLDNIKEGAEMLLKHLRKENRICVICDADADGYSSSSILWLYIKKVFPSSNLDFTIHEHKQHGLEDKTDWFINEEQYDLIIAPDAASFDGKFMRQLQEIGTEVLCLDHHTLPDDYDMEKETPSNAIIINNQLSPNYPNKSLCGAGVVYKFCEVLDDVLGINLANEFIDLAALGEIADVMNRCDVETNYIIMEGLRNIKNEGLMALIEAQSYSLKERAQYPYSGLTPIDIAFYIAPLINAIIRVGSLQEKETLFYCFTDPNKVVKSTKRGAKPEDTETASEQTARVGANAKARQNKIKERALDLIDFKIQKENLNENNIIIVELEEEDKIPQEMTGLIAMAVVSKYGKPCMIGRKNSLGNVQGSIRSDGNFAGLPSFKKFLEESQLMNFVAGHDNSAGWGIKEDNLEELLEYANKNLNDEDFSSSYLVDYVFKADERELIPVGMEIASCPELFGNGIDEVKVIITDIPLSNILIMGADKSSIKISSNYVDYIKFKDLDFIEEVMDSRQKKITIKGRFNLNNWQNHKSLQVFIEDYDFQEEDDSRFDF